MFPGAKVVAVDDDPAELARITGSLRELGIGCIAYNYPTDIPPEAFAFASVRVIFMDINLIGGTSSGNDPNVFAAPISLVDRIISPENGPYALITWSDTNLHSRLLQRIDVAHELAAKQPFYSCGLSKAEYAGDPEKLRSEVQKIFGGIPSFGALLDWERRVARAGDSVLADIYRHSQGFAGQSPAEKLDHMLSRLAVAAFGTTHADTHRFEAVNEALLQIMGDALNAQFAIAEGAEIWDGAVTKCSDNTQLSPSASAALNSAVLIEVHEGIQPYRRGAILKLPDGWLKPQTFAYRFGATPGELQTHLLKQADDASLQWVLIQAQAACDFNQPKKAPIPYFLGAVVAPSSLNGKKLPQSVFVTPMFAPAGGLSADRFKLGIIHGSPHYLTLAALKRNRFTVLGRLKDQLVGAISHQHHQHGSRPGFLQFSGS